MSSNGNLTNKSSLLHGCNGEVQHTLHQSESTLMGIIMLLMIVVSLFGNSLVILAVYKYQRLRNITNTLLCSLAFSDLLSPVFRVTFIAISALTERWVFGCSWCAASSQIGIFFCAASIAHLCAITLERYVKIMYPYHHNMWLTKKKVYITVLIIWMVAVVLALLPFIFKSKIDLRFNKYILYCEVHLVRNPYLSIIMSLIFFAIPFILMLIAYSRIFMVAHQQNKKMSVCSLGDRATKQKRLMRQEWKAVKTVVIVVGVFFILWSPYFVIAIVQAYHPDQPYWVSRFALCCAYLNTCCNWVVYSVLNKELRAGFLKLLNIKIKRTPKEQHNIPMATTNASLGNINASRYNEAYNNSPGGGVNRETFIDKTCERRKKVTIVETLTTEMNDIPSVETNGSLLQQTDSKQSNTQEDYDCKRSDVNHEDSRVTDNHSVCNEVYEPSDDICINPSEVILHREDTVEEILDDVV